MPRGQGRGSLHPRPPTNQQHLSARRLVSFIAIGVELAYVFVYLGTICSPPERRSQEGRALAKMTASGIPLTLRKRLLNNELNE